MGYFIFDTSTNNLNIEEIHHIKDVLRLKPNSKIQATDGQGYLYNLKIKSTKPFCVDILNKEIVPRDNIYIRCIIATIKIPLLELIIQKLTEIGIDELIITKTKFSQISLDKLDNKLSRWENIINTACKQSERLYFTKISIQDIYKIEYQGNNEINLIGDTQYMQNTKSILDIKLDNIKYINLFIGPEGGFEEQEYLELLDEYNYIPVSLSKNILRSETAAIVGAGIIKSLSL